MENGKATALPSPSCIKKCKMVKWKMERPPRHQIHLASKNVKWYNGKATTLSSPSYINPSYIKILNYETQNGIIERPPCYSVHLTSTHLTLKS
ncbi:hypothetical protein SAMN04488023_10387 [Pedobacter rhizosphaerae]|uniref:Uncharacterized protein n=1 Tax=Pedobacter rhizosphaerae TaxID=390241 RepID=A0A1H9KNZ9_9SPHI|nr:hypothetical protein SAMN04488023_10387 [Pedobacter rhizosphaerae]